MNRSRVSTIVGLAVIAGFALAGRASRAQTEAPPTPPPRQDVFYVRTGPVTLSPDDMMDFVGFEEGLDGQTVTGAPFTATISRQTTQVLADGNRIEHKTTGTIARDSQGRTRRDFALPAIGPWAASSQPPHVIFINDPVAGTQYVLEPDRKVAHELRPGGRQGIQKFSDAGPQGEQEQGFLEGAPSGEQGQETTASLGTQTINGVTAQGTRTTRTIPAGAIGNEKPIVITTERWYSPDLLMVVMNKRSDPLRGDSIRQLTDIQRQEPDASLFQVPSDYTVRKGGAARVFIQRGPGGLGPGPEAFPVGPETAPAPPPPPQD